MEHLILTWHSAVTKAEYKPVMIQAFLPIRHWEVNISGPYALTCLSVGLLWPQGHLAQGGWGVSLLSHQHDRFPGWERGGAEWEINICIGALMGSLHWGCDVNLSHIQNSSHVGSFFFFLLSSVKSHLGRYEEERSSHMTKDNY